MSFSERKKTKKRKKGRKEDEEEKEEKTEIDDKSDENQNDGGFMLNFDDNQNPKEPKTEAEI